MTALDRRTFLRRSAVASAAFGAALADPLACWAAAAAKPDFRNLGPVPDLRDGVVRLRLPAGFQYRSFHDTESGRRRARRRHDAARPPRRHGCVPGAATGTCGWSATTRSTDPAPAFGRRHAVRRRWRRRHDDRRW